MKILMLVAGLGILSTSLGLAEDIKITTVSHRTDTFGYTINTPTSTNTNCNVYESNVNCNTTSYGGGTQQKAVYRMTEIVTANGSTYTLQRSARWVWQNTDFLNDGEVFDAKIKGKDMLITCRRGGNQGKKETLKYRILDIR